MNALLILRVAWRALAKNKMRAGLTILGVVIGIAAVTAMVSIGQSASGLVQSQFEMLGTNVIVVLPGSHSRGGVRQGMVNTLTARDSEAMGTECPVGACRHPHRGHGGTSDLRQRQLEPQGNPRLWRRLPHRPQLATPARRVLYGSRHPRLPRKVCVIGQTLVEKLFQTSNPLGETIRIRNFPAASSEYSPRRARTWWGKTRTISSCSPIRPYASGFTAPISTTCTRSSYPRGRPG